MSNMEQISIFLSKILAGLNVPEWKLTFDSFSWIALRESGECSPLQKKGTFGKLNVELRSGNWFASSLAMGLKKRSSAWKLCMFANPGKKNFALFRRLLCLCNSVNLTAQEYDTFSLLRNHCLQYSCVASFSFLSWSAVEPNYQIFRYLTTFSLVSNTDGLWQLPMFRGGADFGFLPYPL